MAVVRQENLQMTIPALLHLSRLGYTWVSKEQLRRRDRRTNFLPEVFRTSLERINSIPVSPEMSARLMEELLAQLDTEDLGRQFYGTLRDGWDGLKLIDFRHPERNAYHSAAEMACGRGAGSFRPDITLFVNGLPLAMIELKRRERNRSLQAEYDRMLARSQGGEGRRYLQCPQVWAFSDDHADEPDRLIPVEGEYFATVMADEFPVYAFSRKDAGSRPRLLPLDEEEAGRILRDCRLTAAPHTRAFRKSLSPARPTHRMLTALFLPERFLFLLRYGIQYIEETDSSGRKMIARRMLSARQLSVLRTLIRKAERGWRNWTLPACGAAGEAAMNRAVTALLRDLYPDARLYWVSAGETASPDQELPTVLCASPQEILGRLRVSSGRSIVFLPETVFLPGSGTAFSAGLRRADPDAILITRSGEPVNDLLFSRFVPSPVLRIHDGPAGP